MKLQRLQLEIKLLKRQLNAAVKLLEHQDKHLVFLESLLGKTAEPETQSEFNKQLQKDIKELLKRNQETVLLKENQ